MRRWPSVRAAALAHVEDEVDPVPDREPLTARQSCVTAALARVQQRSGARGDRARDAQPAITASVVPRARASQALRTDQSRARRCRRRCARAWRHWPAEPRAALDEAAFHRLEQQWRASQTASPTSNWPGRYERSREIFQSLLARHARARKERAPLQARAGERCSRNCGTRRRSTTRSRSARAATLQSTQAAWDRDTGARIAGAASASSATRCRDRGAIATPGRRAHRRAQPLREGSSPAVRARSVREPSIGRGCARGARGTCPEDIRVRPRRGGAHARSRARPSCWSDLRQKQRRER